MDNTRDCIEDLELCLVCCSKVESWKEKDNLLCKNLLVVFLLKNVMQVCDEQLEENLKISGNPCDWLRLCEECYQLTRQALDLHCQVVKIDRELWSVQNLIVEKTKSSLSPPVSVGQHTNVWEWTRAFVKKAKFQNGSLPVDPFIEGDKLATANYYLRRNFNQAAGKKHNSVKIKSEQVNIQSISDNEGDDDDWQQDYDNDDDKDEDDSDDSNRNSPNKQPNYPERKRVNINGKIQCKYCSKLFYTSSGCTKHEHEKHPIVPNQYPCAICGIAWNSGVYLQKHMLRLHKVHLNKDQITKLKSKTVKNLQLQKSEEPPISSTPIVKTEPLNYQTSDVEEAGNFESDNDDADWQLDENDEQLSNEDDSDNDVIKTTTKPVKKGQRKKVNGKFKCYYCDKVFARIHGCYRHELEVHPVKPAQFYCKICDKYWNSREYLTRHQKEVHPSIPNQYPCKICGKPCNTQGYLHKHMKRLHKNGKKFIPKKIRLRVNGKVKCYFCEKLFAKLSGCIRHEHEKHSKIPAQFPCEICGKAWNSKDYLMQHVRNVHKVGVGSTRLKVSHRHRLNAAAVPRIEKPEVYVDKSKVPEARKEFKFRKWVGGKVQCYYCEKLFACAKGCYRHEKENHSGKFAHKIGLAKNSDSSADSKIIKEENVAISDNDVEDHEEEFKKKIIAVKTSRVPLKKYKKPKRYKYRMRINGKIKCYYCDKLFARTTGCYKHENEKHCKIPAQFPCHICGRTWNSKEYLGIHLKQVHKTKLSEKNDSLVSTTPKVKNQDGQVGSKNKVARKTTKNSARFKFRERINGKMKCFHCDKLFASQAGCYMHEKEKHAKVPGQFRCEICDKAWNSKEYLSKHLRRAHGMESKEIKDFFLEVREHASSTTVIGDGDGDSEIPKFSTENIQENATEKPIISTVKTKSDIEPNSEEENGASDKDVECDGDDNDFQLDDVPSCTEEDEDVQDKLKRSMDVVAEKSTEKSPEQQINKLRYSSRGKPFSCKLCDKKFRDKFGLGRHERSHKNEKRRERNEQSSQKCDFKKARGSRQLDGKFKCDQCSEQFTCAGDLRNHGTNHKYAELISKGEDEDGTVPPEIMFQSKPKRNFEWVDGKLKCGSCDKEFSSEAWLVKHEQEKHVGEEGKFICELCGKVCTNLEKLRGHKKRVHLLKADGTPFVPRNYKLKKADREEYGLPGKNGKGKRGINYLRVDGKLKCNSCDRLFISPDGLYKHERAKHPERPGEFVCTHCGLAFNSLDYLSKHTERKHWLRLDGTEKIPPWVATRKYKWKKSEK